MSGDTKSKGALTEDGLRGADFAAYVRADFTLLGHELLLDKNLPCMPARRNALSAVVFGGIAKIIKW